MEIRKILFWIFFILAVVFVIGYIIGDSPTFEQSLLALILTILIKQNDSMNDIRVKINIVESKLNIIENKINLVENRVDKLEK